MTDPVVDAASLAVVIPTSGRWDVLRRTLEALDSQTVQGFETVVVVDGNHLEVPPDVEGRDLVLAGQPASGPAAARNRGVSLTPRPIVLFLGDDMIPDAEVIARHVARHRAEPADEVAVLGHVEWHDDVAGGAIQQWLEWSGSQFDYDLLRIQTEAGLDDAGFARFFSCNVSVKRSLFAAAGGFDERFTDAAYEDTDCGWRLAEAGMQLRYEPAAIVRHLHSYDWPGLVRRFEAVARGERRMAAKHPWFSPWFKGRIDEACTHRPVSGAWVKAAHRVPSWAGPARRLVRRRADRWYHQRLAPAFRAAWEGEREREELVEYLGPRFDERRLRNSAAAVDEEFEQAGDEATFYRTSEAYLYDLTAFAMTGTKLPYLEGLTRHVPVGGSVLDYGCGIGSDGLRLLEAGYRVSFADFDNPSTTYLRWRLRHRGLEAPVYDVDEEVPGGHDAVISFDVIEHVDDPMAFLDLLEARARLVCVNLLEPDPGDAHPHRPLPVPELLDRARRAGLIHHSVHHGRSHLVIYRSSA